MLSFLQKSSLFLVLAILILGGLYVARFNLEPESFLAEEGTMLEEEEKVLPFKSNQEFKKYLQEAEQMGEQDSFRVLEREELLTPSLKGPEVDIAFQEASPEGKDFRFSTTNVQVEGIDEPDIVKQDGRNIYYSRKESYVVPMLEGDVELKRMPPYRQEQTIKIIRAFPLQDLALTGEIATENGELLLSKNTLLIFFSNGIKGYDVSRPEEVKKVWDFQYQGTQLVTARLYNGLLYVILKKSINRYSSCPLPVGKLRDTTLEMRCPEIYYPITPIYTDITYNILVFDPQRGAIKNKLAFVGSQANSVIYMSQTALYVTYERSPLFTDLLIQFLDERGKDLIPLQIIKEINEINSYNISYQSKTTEILRVLEEYFSSLEDKDQQIQLKNNYTNALNNYLNQHKRELYRTGIVKIEIQKEELDVIASGSFAGRLLNQFSLDEYKGNLRVATTIGGRGRWGGSIERENDVLVLDKDLKLIGQINSLGITERIYAVRFLGELGYVVTFREIDPFYIIDFSNPRSLQLKSELKIPGYSAYLHPLQDNLILGVGKEGSQVKLSLFDVSQPTNPQEVDKYLLDEHWSGVLKNHRAFLQDKEREIFFVPGNKAGYIFSYQGERLSLIKALAAYKPERALYIDQFFYLVAPRKIVVFNEENWEEVAELSLE